METRIIAISIILLLFLLAPKPKSSQADERQQLVPRQDTSRVVIKPYFKSFKVK